MTRLTNLQTKPLRCRWNMSIALTNTTVLMSIAWVGITWPMPLSSPTAHAAAVNFFRTSVISNSHLGGECRKRVEERLS